MGSKLNLLVLNQWPEGVEQGCFYDESLGTTINWAWRAGVVPVASIVCR